MAAFVTPALRPLTDLTNARVDVLTALVSASSGSSRCSTCPAPSTTARRRRPRSARRGRDRVDDVCVQLPAGRRRVARLARGRGRRRSPTSRDPVLHDVDVRHRAGQMVALVGPVGRGQDDAGHAGPAALRRTGGASAIDGHDVRDLTLETLRGAIGVVSPGPAPLPRVGRSPTSATPSPSHRRRDRSAACRAARIHDVIAALPDGLRHGRRRAGLPPVRRREAAPGHRPDAAEGPAPS